MGTGYTRRAMAGWLGIHPRQLRKWVREGRIALPLLDALNGARRNGSEREALPRQLFLVKDVMSGLDVSRSTLERWRRAGCPHYDFSGSIRFDLDEVRLWRSARENLGQRPF